MALTDMDRPANAADGRSSEQATTRWARLRQWALRRLRPGRVRESVAGPHPATSVDSISGGDVLAAVGAACEAGERLRFDFQGRDGSHAVRDVEPYRLIRSGRHWYLLAYDTQREDWRTFRLDRISPRGPSGPRFVPREVPVGDDAPYLSTGGIDGLPPAAPPDPAVVDATAGWARDMLRPGAAVVLDTETTDLPGAICEIAVVDAATGEILLDTLVDPGLPMSPRAQAVHGLADSDLVGAPTWAAVLPELLAVASGRQVLAYNAEFDASVIRTDTDRYGLTLGPLEASDRWDCVMLRRAQTLPGGSALALGAGHRARGDALAARAVLQDLAALRPAA